MADGGAAADIRVIGICRFALLGRGDWKAYRDGSAGDAAIIARQAEVLFAPARLEARLKSFELLTLASLGGQSDQDFRFVVLSSEQMPAPFRARLAALCAGVPQVSLHFCPVTTAPAAQRALFRERGIRYGEVLQFRLDDDDCLAVDFIRRMKEATAASMAEDGIFVAAPRGVVYSARGGAAAGVYDWPVDFMSAGAAIRHPSKSIYEFGHFGMARRFPALPVADCPSLVLHDGTNDTPFTAGLAQRRQMRRMRAPRIEHMRRRFYPFLSPEACRMTGLLPARARPPAPAAPPAAKPAAPEVVHWLDDLHGTRHRRGFYIAEERFALQHTLRSRQVLHVGFDNLASVRSPQRNRDAWGYALAAGAGWSHLGVLDYRPDWFRNPQLFAELQRLADQGFFARFRQVVFSGTSMGGHAACAFASLAPGCTVIAYSPQSTLDPGIAGWDRRYPSGSAADWSGPFADAAESLRAAGRAWVVFDPAVPEDRRHAGRLAGAGAGVTLLRARHSAHFTAQYLRQIGVLKRFALACVAGEMSESAFYALYRQGRHHRRHLTGVVAQALRHPDPARRARLARVLRDLGRAGLAADLERAG